MHVRDSNELERLRALHEFKYVPGQQVSAMDHVAKVAMDHFKVPMAFVSLVDEAEQCFIGRQGVSINGTPRNQAFCRYTILTDDVLVVEDTTMDERFAANPLVTGDPFIRFYAGAPLKCRESIRLGTVCIVDKVPRTLNFGQKVVLRQLAAMAMAELRALN